MLVTLVLVIMLCSVSLIPPTAVVTTILVVHRETGSFPVELEFLLVALTSTETGNKALYV